MYYASPVRPRIIPTDIKLSGRLFVRYRINDNNDNYRTETYYVRNTQIYIYI